MANEENKGTLTKLLEDVIVKADNGQTLMAPELKKVCELCINSMAKYREQNRHCVAFELIAKRHLPKEMLDSIEYYTQRLLELEAKTDD